MVTAQRSTAAAGTAPGPDSSELTALERELLRLAGEVPDPELPVASLAELGVLRGIRVVGPGRVRVELTPTWTACPALETMATDVTEVLKAAGMDEVDVRTVLAPAWTTDAISPEGRRKLAAAGIAPPRPQTLGGPQGGGPHGAAGGGARSGDGTAGTAGGGSAGPVALDLAIRCPHCGSTDNRLMNRFSSTACMSLRRCTSCGEPFDHFKEV